MKLIYHHFARFGLEMHIGHGNLESKTKCIFFPPPQFFQHLERTNTAASTIQCAFHQSNQANSRCIAAQEPPPRSSTPPNNCYNPTVPHDLSHWMPRHRHAVPFKACQYHRHSDATHSKVCYSRPQRSPPQHNPHPSQVPDNYPPPGRHLPTTHQHLPLCPLHLGNPTTHCTPCH